MKSYLRSFQISTFFLTLNLDFLLQVFFLFFFKVTQQIFRFFFCPKNLESPVMGGKKDIASISQFFFFFSSELQPFERANSSWTASGKLLCSFAASVQIYLLPLPSLPFWWLRGHTQDRYLTALLWHPSTYEGGQGFACLTSYLGVHMTFFSFDFLENLLLLMVFFSYEWLLDYIVKGSMAFCYFCCRLKIGFSWLNYATWLQQMDCNK